MHLGIVTMLSNKHIDGPYDGVAWVASRYFGAIGGGEGPNSRGFYASCWRPWHRNLPETYASVYLSPIQGTQNDPLP